MKRVLSAALIVGLLAQPGWCLAEEGAAEVPVVETQMSETVATPVPQTATPEPEPTQPVATPVPEATPVPQTATPAPEVTPETSPEATPETTPETSPEATPETSPEVTPETSPEATPETSPEATPEVTPDPGEEGEIPVDAEAWMQSAEGMVYGKLADMIAQAQAGMEIYLHVDTPMYVEKAPLKRLSELKLTPDEKIFREGKYQVLYSEQSPLEVEEPQLIDPETFKDALEEDVANLYIWVVKVEEEPQPTETPDAEVSIQVTANDYMGAAWSSISPVFELSGIPEGKAWSYAVVIYDERIAVLSENLYTAEEEGVYTVRFAILDEAGDIVDASELYTLWLDRTAPEVSVTMDEAVSYTLHVAAQDGMSGVDAVSLDGGVTWTAMPQDAPFTYTAPGETTLGAGMLQVRDLAGNVWASTESYTLTAVISGGGGSWGGGGGGGGSGEGGTKPKPHAKGDGQDTGEYNALILELPEKPMRTLTVDGEELPLTLELTRAEGFEVPETYSPTFTAELATWAVEETAEEAHDSDEDEDEDEESREPLPDTLILKAVEEERLGDRFEYRWKFNGEVYRLLNNSGIRYLVLAVGEDMVTLPTEGFTGGTAYTKMKMQGVSTRKFDYTLSMSFNLDPDRIPMLSQYDFSEDCDIAIQTEVEGEKYVLSAEQKGEMYYYDVYVGSKEMMEVPYGTFGEATGMATAENGGNAHD